MLVDSPVRAEMRDPRVRHVIIAVLPHPPASFGDQGDKLEPLGITLRLSMLVRALPHLVCSRGPRTICSRRSKHVATQATGDCEIEGRRATQPPLRDIDVSRAASLCSDRCAGLTEAQLSAAGRKKPQLFNFGERPAASARAARVERSLLWRLTRSPPQGHTRAWSPNLSATPSHKGGSSPQ